MGKLDKFKKKPPSVTPTVSDRPVQVVVRDSFTNLAVKEAVVSIQVAQGDYFRSGLTNENGIIVLLIPPAIRNTHLIVEKSNYFKYDHSILLQPDVPQSLDINLRPKTKTAGTITIIEKSFYLDSKLGRIQGISAFPTFQHYLEGEIKKVNDLFDFARSINANCLRVLGEIGWTDFDPLRYSDYYDQLDEFLTFCKFQGFYVDYNCFAMRERYTSLNQARLHAARTSMICSKHPNALFTLANEPFKNLPLDSTVYDYAADIQGVIWNYGASGIPKLPYIPSGTFTSEHTPRDAEWFRKSKHAQETQEITGVPDLLAEPMGAIDKPGTGTSSERDSDPRHFLEYFATASLFGSSVFHSEKLKFGLVPENNEYQCALSAKQGWSIPVEFMQGEYSAGHIDTCPLKNPEEVMKMYFSILGHRAYGVLIQPSSRFKLETNDNWQVKEVQNSCIVYLER